MARKKIDCGPPIELSTKYIIDSIKRRCDICPDCGERTSFLGCQNASGVYPMKVNQKWYSVRRVIFEHHGGKLRKNGKIITTCPNHRCIDPEKLVQVSMRQIIKQAVADGKFMTEITRAKIAKAKRKTHGKIEQATAESIRFDSRTSNVIAKETGISESYVRAIRSGAARKSYGSNPFSGLGAR